jgi:L-alanine-DL-glutamate epimerase-like enolase superfamily enzyme
MAVATRTDVAVESLAVSAFRIPTDDAESDGTFEWDSTTIVVVEARAGGETGLGYTYAPAAAGAVVAEQLRRVVEGSDALAVRRTWHNCAAQLRNAGRPGLGSMALSAVDIALWDLKARLLGQPLVTLLDARHVSVPVYGSGGFTSYSLERLRDQLGAWVADDIPRVKMKLGRNPAADPRRLDAAREAIGDETELYVDANGAFQPKHALAWARRYAREWSVSWFEEPVSSDDVDGLRLVREHAPLDVAAGEYAHTLADFRELLGAVDCLQADVTRCGGITGLLDVGGFAHAHAVPVSGHCAPGVSAHAFAAVPTLRHLEWFHDHVRVERLLFDGFLEPERGALRPDLSRPGHGLELKRRDADPYVVS